MRRKEVDPVVVLSIVWSTECQKAILDGNRCVSNCFRVRKRYCFYVSVRIEPKRSSIPPLWPRMSEVPLQGEIRLFVREIPRSGEDFIARERKSNADVVARPMKASFDLGREVAHVSHAAIYYPESRP